MIAKTNVGADKAMHDILIVDDSDSQRQLLEELLTDQGYSLRLARSGDEAMEKIRERLPDLVLTDWEMPSMSGLELLEQIQADFGFIPVVIATAKGSEEAAVEALKKGAAGYLPKRVMSETLAEVVRDIFSVAETRRTKDRLRSRLRQIAYEFELENDISLIPPLVAEIQESLRFLTYSESTRFRVGLAMHEAITNAMIHGNLEVCSDLRREEEALYYELIRQRQEQAPFSRRRVRFAARLSLEQCWLQITDAGPGFDQQKVRASVEEDADNERPCGRGLIIIRSFMDEAAHNARGNEITMIKRNVSE